MIFVLGNTVGTIHDDFPLLVEQALVFGPLVALGVCDGRDLKLVHLRLGQLPREAELAGRHVQVFGHRGPCKLVVDEKKDRHIKIYMS